MSRCNYLLTTLLALTVLAGTTMADPLTLIRTEQPSGTYYTSPMALEQNYPFSDAVETSGSLVFLSGMIGTDADGSLMPGGLEPEVHAIFRDMKATLTKLGLGLDDVVKCLVMIDDIERWGDFNAIYTQYFTPPYPARSAFGAEGLALGAAVELECIAARH